MLQDSALFSSNRIQQHPRNREISVGTIQQAPTLSTKVVHGSGQDPIFGGSDGDKDGFRGRRSDVDIRDVLHCPAEENISVISHPILPHEQRTLQCGHRCFLLFLGRFCVHIHCGGDVCMTHDFLNDFQIGFVFAEAGCLLYTSPSPRDRG